MVFKATPVGIEEEENKREPDISYDRIFRVLNDGLPVGKDYLKRYQNTPACGRNGLDQFHDLQKQVRQVFTNPGDVSVSSVLFCNYKHNKQAKEACMAFIRKRADGLGGIILYNKDGEPETFRWRDQDIFKYFIEHKSYYQKNYKKRKEEMELLFPSIPPTDNEQLPLAILESRDEEVDVVQEVAKRKNKEKSLQKKKKSKKTMQINLDIWEDLNDADKLTICHKLTGVDSRQKVQAYLRKWVFTRKKTGQSHPTILKDESSEMVVHNVAFWALENGLIEVIGEKGVAGYSIENFKLLL